MGYVVQVSTERVGSAAAQLDEVGQGLEAAGEALARVLLLVGPAAGGGSLALAAEAAARQWRLGMSLVAQQGRSLAAATAEAAEAYRAVEALTTDVLAARATWTRGTP